MASLLSQQDACVASNGILPEDKHRKLLEDFCTYYKLNITSINFKFKDKFPVFLKKGENAPIEGLRNLHDHINSHCDKKMGFWLEFCENVLIYTQRRPDFLDPLQFINEYLCDKTFFSMGCKNVITAADTLMYLFLYDIMGQLSFQEKEMFSNVSRWFDLMQHDDKLRSSRSLILFSRIKLY